MNKPNRYPSIVFRVFLERGISTVCMGAPFPNETPKNANRDTRIAIKVWQCCAQIYFGPPVSCDSVGNFLRTRFRGNERTKGCIIDLIGPPAQSRKYTAMKSAFVESALPDQASAAAWVPYGSPPYKTL